MDELDKAVEFIKAKDNNSAQKILSDLIRKDPKNENAWFLLATCIPDVHKKRYCLQNVLEINPKNLYAIQLLTSLDTKPLSNKSLDKVDENKNIPESNSVKLISANCPNCGGALKISENTKVTECPYCGHSVIIQDPTRVSVEKSFDSHKYLMLAKLAEKSWNYQDAFNYYSQIIENDFENVEAWLGKGFTAGMLSTEKNLRIKEASDCTHQAFELASSSVNSDNGDFMTLTIKRLDLIVANLGNYAPSNLYNELNHVGLISINFAPYFAYINALILAWEYDPSIDKTNKITYEVEKYIKCTNLAEKWTIQASPSTRHNTSVFFNDARSTISLFLKSVNFEAVAKKYDRSFNLNNLCR
jgi:tetratricopeptide (TPR) repeat protein